jgi:hypothetical protein
LPLTIRGSSMALLFQPMVVSSSSKTTQLQSPRPAHESGPAFSI